MSVLKIIGILIMIGFLAFSGVLYVSVSRLEKEIEAEIRDQGAE